MVEETEKRNKQVDRIRKIQPECKAGTDSKNRAIFQIKILVRLTQLLHFPEVVRAKALNNETILEKVK